MTFIRPQNCTACKFAAQTGAESWECRNGPPTAQLLVGQAPNGAPMHLGTISAFPPVNERQWCSQFAPRLLPN